MRLQTWKKAKGWCTAQWKTLLFCEEEEEEEDFGRLATFWFSTFMMLFSATGCVVHHEST